jgi:hypothetical protein
MSGELTDVAGGGEKRDDVHPAVASKSESTSNIFMT